MREPRGNGGAGPGVMTPGYGAYRLRRNALPGPRGLHRPGEPGDCHGALSAQPIASGESLARLLLFFAPPTHAAGLGWLNGRAFGPTTAGIEAATTRSGPNTATFTFPGRRQRSHKGPNGPDRDAGQPGNRPNAAGPGRGPVRCRERGSFVRLFVRFARLILFVGNAAFPTGSTHPGVDDFPRAGKVLFPDPEPRRGDLAQGQRAGRVCQQLARQARSNACLLQLVVQGKRLEHVAGRAQFHNPPAVPVAGHRGTPGCVLGLFARGRLRRFRIRSFCLDIVGNAAVPSRAAVPAAVKAVVDRFPAIRTRSHRFYPHAPGNFRGRCGRRLRAVMYSGHSRREHNRPAADKPIVAYRPGPCHPSVAQNSQCRTTRPAPGCVQWISRISPISTVPGAEAGSMRSAVRGLSSVKSRR